jgi:hypothetical protein
MSVYWGAEAVLMMALRGAQRELDVGV